MVICISTFADGTYRIIANYEDAAGSQQIEFPQDIPEVQHWVGTLLRRLPLPDERRVAGVAV